MKSIIFETVTFSYSRRLLKKPVVDDVSLTVSAGEMVGLLGPNGAGKSTLLHLAAGVLQPQRGSIFLEGERLAQLGRREIARRVAVVPQDFSVQFAYTVQQIVEMGRAPHTGSFGTLRAADRAAVQAALAETGLLPLAGRIFNELSGGERQRAVVSLALAQHAPILLLDEPTAHLDIRHQIEVLELLRRLNREQGMTVLAALHDLNLAARYFPRLVLFDRRVIADGPPAQVLDETILSRIYQTPVQVGILRGEEHLSVLPPGYLPAIHAIGQAIGQSPSLPGSAGGNDAAGSIEEGAEAGAAKGDERPGYVHVLAGGGSGELLMRSLADAQIPFSAGPLNAGDSDALLAQRLAELCILEPPYAAVSEVGLASAREHMLRASAVIVAPMPLGRGNISLLQGAAEARRAGVPVLLFEPGYVPRYVSPARERVTSPPTPDPADPPDDFSDDFAAVAARDFSTLGVDAYRQLVAAGAERVTSQAEVLARLRTFL